MLDPTPARNAPCPCGSGRKSKHCCFAPAVRDIPAPDELAWQRHRRALDGIASRLLSFTVETYGPQAIQEAWSEFLLLPKEPLEFDPDSPQITLFMPWCFHRWSPDRHGTTVEDPALHGCPPTRAFLERQGRRLDPTLRRYLERCLDTPLSFHEVIAVTPGRGFHALDVLTGDEHQVTERSGSQMLKPGDLLFAQLVTVDGLTILEACPPVSLPPTDKIAVIELRRKIHRVDPTIDAAILHDWNYELRRIYVDAAARLYAPSPPQLHNTDGDPMEPQRLIYDLPTDADAVPTAFEALRHLAAEEVAADALANAERDAAGRPTSLGFAWVRRSKRRASLQDTVLGFIEIRPGRLICAVNSTRRAAAFRRHVKKALPTLARFRVAEIESLEYALANAPVHGGFEDRPKAPLTPEDEALMARYLADYYARWLHEKIPAIGGRTPLAAVRDPDGREQVEALVRGIERDGPRMDPPLDAAVPQWLRQQLGLKKT